MVNEPRVLLYHGVIPKQRGLNCDVLKVIYQEDFERQLKVVKKIFNILHPMEYLELRSKEKLPPRSLLITFDDGFDNIFRYALPVAEALKIPITVFCCTQNIKEKKWLWFSRLYASQLRQIEGWKKIEKQYQEKSILWINEALHRITAPDFNNGIPLEHLLFSGVSEADLKKHAQNEYLIIGGHTGTHPRLTNETEEKVYQEIKSNKAYLESIIEKPISMFAYPEGDYDEQTARLVRNAGYTIAFAVEKKRQNFPGFLEAYQIPRTGIYKTNIPYLLAKIWLRKP